MKDMILNEDQQKAVDCKDNKILCLAGAGTGKTFTMLQRISKMVSDGVSPNSILVLTFTNAAALEMKSRYQESHKMQKCPEFRTFHAFCYAILTSDKSVRTELKYSKIPFIALDTVIKKTSKEALLQSGVKLSDKQISGQEVLTPKEQKDFEIYQKTLDRLLKKKNLITFDKLCYDVCKLFVDDKDCIQKYKTRYKHIFVDEFQDTDKKQYDFICSFKDADMFVVGDALQALYGFRGADSSIIKSLAENKDWTTIKLHKNYRSCAEICEYANNMSKYADDSFRIEIEGGKFYKPVVTKPMKSSRFYVNDPDCLSICARSATWDGTTAILCRTNSEAKSIQKYFKDNGLPFSMGNKADIGYNVLKSVEDKNFMIEWLASLLYSDQYSIYIRESFDNNSYDVDKFLSKFSRNNEIIRSYAGTIKAVEDILSKDEEMLYKWIDIFNILNVKCQQMPEDITNNGELISAIEDCLSSGISDDSSVYIGTIHSSKGLEYDNVILVNVNGRSFPLTSEDNLNVFYVGITRAKKDLWVFRGDDSWEER